MNIVNKKLWYRALDRAVPETYNQLSPEQLAKAIDAYTELIIKECIKESMDEIVSDEDLATETDPMIREYLLGHNQGIVDAVVRFRNHFGVTE